MGTEVTITVYADGDQRRVEIETPDERLSAPFELSENAFLNLDGRPLSDSPRRGLSAVPDLDTLRDLQGSGEREPTRCLGERLFEALFPGRLRQAFDRARQRYDPLNLRLAWDADEARLAMLHGLPWELMRFPETSAPLVFESSLGFSRGLQQAVFRPAMEQPLETLRVVAVAANPRGTAPLQLGPELDGLKALHHENRALEVLPAPKNADLMTLRRLLEAHRATVLHFMGHGDLDRHGAGVLLLEGPDGDIQEVTGEDLALALQGLSDLRLVVLNACRTAEAQGRARDAVAVRLIQSGMPAVIAMQAPIPDDVAVAFSAELYSSLSQGRRLERAVCAARGAALARAPGTRDWAIPVLFSNVPGKTLAGLDENELPAPDQVLRRHYLSSIVEDHSFLGIEARRGLSPQPLQAVYTRFRQASDRFDSPIHDPATLGGLLPNDELDPGEELWWLWRSLRARDRESESHMLHEILTRHRRLFWVGEPGSGKTQLLRWLSRHHAHAALDDRPLLQISGELIDHDSEGAVLDLGPVRIPILVDLVEFADFRRRRGPLRLAQFLGFHLSGSSLAPAGDAAGRSFDPEAVGRFLIRELRRDRALLLGDRLDEITDADERLRILQEVIAFVRAFDTPSILVGRPLSSARLALDVGEVRCFELQPLRDRALRRMCLEWNDPHSGGKRLLELVDRLHRDGAGELAGNPLIVSVLARIQRQSPSEPPERRLELRRLDIYGPLVEALLDQWGKGDIEPPADPRLELLSDLAAYLQDRPTELGLISGRRLRARLGSHLRDGLGPLQPLGSDLYSFVSRPIQEYLAARWLADDADSAESRLLERLSDSTWRRPAAMALGLLADRIDRREIEALLRRLLGHDGATPVPVAALLLLEARPELPRDVVPPWSEIVSVVLDHIRGESSDDRLDETLIGALAARLRSADLEPLDRALTRVGAARPKSASTLAQIALQAPEIPARLARFLADEGHLDAAPRWIDQALRDLHRRDPSLPEPGSAAHRLRRDEVLAARIQRHGEWRRLMRTVLGDAANPYRRSPLEGWILDRITSRAPLDTLRSELRLWAGYGSTVKARHARLALVALGEAPEIADAAADLGAFDADLNRICRDEPSTPGASSGVPPRVSSWTTALLDAQRRTDNALWINIVRALADRLPVDGRPELFLTLAAASKVSCKAPLLADFWRCLLRPATKTDESCREDRVDPVHRAAVTLDRYGRFLSSPTSLFVNAWIALGRHAVNLPPASQQPSAEHLAAALDVLAEIPDGFDFVRAWALAVLNPELRRHDLLDEAVVLAETSLSDRLGARASARRHLLGSAPVPSLQDLANCAAAITDPWRRYRTLTRLADAADLRADLVENRIAPHRILISPATLAFYGITDPVQRLLAASNEVPSPFEKLPSSGIAPERILGALADLSGLSSEHDGVVLAAMADQARHLTLNRPSRHPLPAEPAVDRSPLARAERGELSPALVEALLQLMNHGDDLERLRARLALHGDRTVLRHRRPSSRVGKTVIFQLADHWLRRRHDPQDALVLRWAFETIVHDRSDVLIHAAERSGGSDHPTSEQESASVVLRFIETVSRDCLPTVREILHRGPNIARRALVRGLCNVLAVDDRSSDVLRQAIAPDWSHAAPAFGDRRISLTGLRGVIDAVSLAIGEGGGVFEAIRHFESAALPWSELLSFEPDQAAHRLHLLGGQRRVGELEKTHARIEAKRVLDHPQLLPICVDWLEHRLEEATVDDIDDLTTSHLSQWLAEAARLRPKLYLSTVESRRSWIRRLTDLAVHGVWMSTRRAAVELLSRDRRLDDRKLHALWAASSDAPEVQRVALESIATFRSLDDHGILEPVETALGHEHPSVVLGAARLLAALARPAYCEPRLRRRVEERLAAAAADPNARRLVHGLRSGSDPKQRRLSIVELGRLDALIRGLLMDIQWPRSPNPWRHKP